MYITVLDLKQATNELAVILLLGQNNGVWGLKQDLSWKGE